MAGCEGGGPSWSWLGAPPELGPADDDPELFAEDPQLANAVAPRAGVTPLFYLPDDENEAVAVANVLGYGLAAGVYTRDIGRAMAMSRKLEHGSVWINGWWMGGVQAPTGGMKESGIGRERGLACIRNYLEIKNVAIRV